MPIGRRFKLLTIRGVPLYVGMSWIWIAALVVYLQYFRLTNETLDPPSQIAAIWLAVIASALFFGSILIHESAHAMVARSFDLPVAGITLVFWGGATETKANAKGAWPEFLISLVGPASTLAVAGGLWLLGRVTHGHLSAIIQDLAWLNLFFAGLNALPGFPLDGGRMLLAATWGISHNRSTALRVAGTAGIFVGMGMLAAAFISLGNNSGYWLFLGYIGFVMIVTGRATIARIGLRERLAVGTVADAMRPQPDGVPATISLSEALDRWLRANPDRTFPVTDAGRVIGTISMESARKVGRARPTPPRARGHGAAEPDAGGHAERQPGRRRRVDRRSRRAGAARRRPGRSDLTGRRRTLVPPSLGGRRTAARGGGTDPAPPGPPEPLTWVSATAGSIRDVAPLPFSPDDAQRRVLDHTGGALLVTGTSGTGKTAVLRELFARLIEDGADPERVVLVTGSTRARDETRAHLLARLSSSLSGLQVVTAHGLAHRVLKQRHDALGYAEPPAVLSAAEQFAKVRDLLAGQDPADWPAYGHLLSMRGFADEVRQFLLRAQEELRTPEDIEAAADRRGLSGWHELARFLREYQEVLDDLNAVDFAALLQRAAAALAPGGDPLFDHVLVDDYQDTTFATEAILHGLGAGDLVVAGNAEAHVFSFQGSTPEPLRRFAEMFEPSVGVELVTRHRAPAPAPIDAWVAPHTSEEHAAIARELRRLHVDDGVAWADLAVVVRRQGPHVGGLLRALDDARVPRAVPERGLTLTSEPATLPYVVALRWLVADQARREELVEQLLTSEAVGLSPAAARGLLRVAQHEKGSIAHALDVDEGLAPGEADQVHTANEVLAKAALFAGMSVQDAFKVLWEELSCSQRLVDGGGSNLDTVVTFANVVSQASEEGDASVEAFLEGLDAGEHGPGYIAWDRSRLDAVRVLTAHGAAGQEFDTVVVAGAVEGNFPSLARPEPMFDLAVLDRSVTRSERVRERLEDERRLFSMVLGRARRRVVLACSDSHPDTDELSLRSRFADERKVSWTTAPTGPFDEPVSVGEASAAWRRQLADLGAPAWRRLAAMEGLIALGVDPSRWWFQRDWTDTGRPLHEHVRVSYSRLSNLEGCELQHVLGDELGLGRPGGYHAWVGKTVHRIIEEVERGLIAKEPRAIVAELDRRWRPQEFPSLAVSTAFHKLAREHMLRNWFEHYGDKPARAIEQYFEFEFEGATVLGYIDRIGPSLQGGSVITDYKTGKSDRAENPADNLQLGIYYLAVQESEALAEFNPVNLVELAFLRGDWKSTDLQFRKWPIHDAQEEAWQTAMRERLAGLIRRKRDLNENEVYRPNPYANCRFCDFHTLCPLFPEGRPIFPVDALRGAPAPEGATA